MSKVFETQSFVSRNAAWHQELTFDEPYAVTVVIENLGSSPIYGFYLSEVDFQSMTEKGEVNDEISSRIEKQLLCENESDTAKVDVTFPVGKQYVCLELDVMSAPNAEQTEFLFSIHEAPES